MSSSTIEEVENVTVRDHKMKAKVINKSNLLEPVGIRLEGKGEPQKFATNHTNRGRQTTKTVVNLEKPKT